MISISLRGSYSPADLCQAFGAALNVPAPANLDALQTLLSEDRHQEIELGWQDFHQATVGELDAAGIAHMLRTAAQANPNLRLIFFDSNRGGQ